MQEFLFYTELRKPRLEDSEITQGMHWNPFTKRAEFNNSSHYWSDCHLIGVLPAHFNHMENPPSSRLL